MQFKWCKNRISYFLWASRCSLLLLHFVSDGFYKCHLLNSLMNSTSWVHEWIICFERNRWQKQGLLLDLLIEPIRCLCFRCRRRRDLWQLLNNKYSINTQVETSYVKGYTTNVIWRNKWSISVYLFEFLFETLPITKDQWDNMCYNKQVRIVRSLQCEISAR